MKGKNRDAAAEKIPLPAWRHIPGVNDRHAGDAFDQAKALCPPRVTDAEASTNGAWLYGLRLFNAGYYWEAHEVLETVWMRTAPNSRERALVQALIHLANGALKLAANKPGAAKRLARLAGECVALSHSGGRDRIMGLGAKELLGVARTLAGDAPMDVRFGLCAI